ncbi:hypothetical protein GWO43_02895, partial [candidate division KSB1 bacterium]|nr:hypothetical protein [candidate division KSB1 bacterium]NIT69855.1 hypothetical protein [candidate division KSB1 bacterium]NIU90478.1 hypothetical protein [candidate division KSB1 bacterium]NIW68517.1 hypothetical protein [candidate division KSB1 bacterium]NIX69536.1 hypothetical protein [candidate division KSB1 bacterium]
IELPRNALYPDDWYQGTVSFADDLWRIDAANGNTERVAQLVGADGVGIDAVDPLLGPDERMLFFINKKDGTPWRVLLERENISGDQSTSAVGS